MALHDFLFAVVVGVVQGCSVALILTLVGMFALRYVAKRAGVPIFPSSPGSPSSEQTNIPEPPLRH